ncbi:MAG: glycerol-3-phosphate dehydrogenase, partial [Bauldia sp.]
MIDSVGVIGGGAWGTALSLVAARAGRRVTLYARDAATVAAINGRNESPVLPGIRLDRAIAATAAIATATAADAV